MILPIDWQRPFEEARSKVETEREKSGGKNNFELEMMLINFCPPKNQSGRGTKTRERRLILRVLVAISIFYLIFASLALIFHLFIFFSPYLLWQMGSNGIGFRWLVIINYEIFLALWVAMGKKKSTMEKPRSRSLHIFRLWESVRTYCHLNY